MDHTLNSWGYKENDFTLKKNNKHVDHEIDENQELLPPIIKWPGGKEKELKYKYIREVTMSQNIIERLFGIGKIKVFTNASSGMNNGAYGNSMRNRNGIQIHCVENVEEQYKKVKELIDNGSQDE